MRFRRVTEDDAPLFEAELCDPAMMEHLGGPITVEQAHDTLRRQLDPATVWSFVIVTDLGEDAGSVCLWRHDGDDPITEIGWMVLPAFQGRGLGKAAVRELLDRADADGRWGPIHAFPEVGNEASNAMCRSLGFELIATETFAYRGRSLTCNTWRYPAAA